MQETVDYSLVKEIKQVSGFKTSKGSIYTYEADGRTTRFKTATQEQMQPQDLTVFVQLTFQQEQDILNAYLEKNNKKVYVIERMPDNSAKMVRSLSDVTDREALYLAVIEDNKTYLVLVPVTLTPTIGHQVYDTRHFQDSNGDYFTERHLGNKVSELLY